MRTPRQKQRDEQDIGVDDEADYGGDDESEGGNDDDDPRSEQSMSEPPAARGSLYGDRQITSADETTMAG